MRQGDRFPDLLLDLNCVLVISIRGRFSLTPLELKCDKENLPL